MYLGAEPGVKMLLETSCQTNWHCKFQESVEELRASELFWLLRHKDKRIMLVPETAPGLSAPIRKTAN
jgi:hypothetical protein